jgi:DNA invertase Pin-like site-specific DNA recombinase
MRFCSRHRSLDRQITALEVHVSDEINREKASGETTRRRPQLEQAPARLGNGDVFVAADWDRAMDGLTLMERIHTAGATILVLDRTALDITTPTGRGLLGLLSAVFEEDRVRIRKRTLQGIAEARRRTKRFGRKPKLTAESATAATVIGRSPDVHHQTIARIA